MSFIGDQNRANQWQDTFYECLALEFSDPSYFKVHHLLVVTYLLQTDGYSANAFEKATGLLEEFLRDSRNALELTRHVFGTGSKDKILNSGERDFMKFPWVRSILDVRTSDSDLYVSDVYSWARSVLSVIRHETV